MTPQQIAGLFIPDIEAWYKSRTKKNGSINVNAMTVGLMMIEHMGAAFPLTETDYRSPGESQVKALGKPRIRRILAAHGETRPFNAESGRTSRGSYPLAVQFAGVLNNSQGAGPYLAAGPDEQAEARHIIQGWIVTLLQKKYFDRAGLTPDIDPGKPVRVTIQAILKAAAQRGGNTSGAVAQHLVGAKLSLRFPRMTISNESYTTADQQTSRPGDFLVGDTAIHVTISPSEQLFSSRCTANIRDGYRPLILVPADRVNGTRDIVGIKQLGERVDVLGIEDFVGQNIGEIGEFTSDGIKLSLKQLLTRYNERVKDVEPDPGLLIVVPSNI